MQGFGAYVVVVLVVVVAVLDVVVTDVVEVGVVVVAVVIVVEVVVQVIPHITWHAERASSPRSPCNLQSAMWTGVWTRTPHTSDSSTPLQFCLLYVVVVAVDVVVVLVVVEVSVFVVAVEVVVVEVVVSVRDVRVDVLVLQFMPQRSGQCSLAKSP